MLLIEANYRPIAIGRSIALHRYFVSEPLRFNDERPDFVVAIAQCTLQGAWEDKAPLLNADAELWGGGWIPIGRPPVTVLAIPFVVSGTEQRYPDSGVWSSSSSIEPDSALSPVDPTLRTSRPYAVGLSGA